MRPLSHAIRLRCFLSARIGQLQRNQVCDEIHIGRKLQDKASIRPEQSVRLPPLPGIGKVERRAIGRCGQAGINSVPFFEGRRQGVTVTRRDSRARERVVPVMLLSLDAAVGNELG